MERAFAVTGHYLQNSLDLAKIEKRNAKNTACELTMRQRDLLLYSLGEDRYACAFQFGVLVLFGFSDRRERNRIIKHFNLGAGESLPQEEFPADEEYSCLVDPDQPESADFDVVRLKQITKDRLLVMSEVLAQSVMLDLLEKQAEKNMGFFAEVHGRMAKQGRLSMGLKPVFRSIGTVGSVTNFIVSRLALLDKPEIAWEDRQVESLFLNLRNMFDIDERFTALRFRLDFIRDSSDTILEALQARRSEILELVIIILIITEVLFGVIGLY